VKKKTWHKWVAPGGAIGGVLLICGLVGMFYCSSRTEPPPGKRKMISSEAGRKILLYFASPNEKKYLTRADRVSKHAALREQIKQVIENMGEKPRRKTQATLWPLPLIVRSLYLRSNGILILDLEKRVKYNQATGTCEELRAVRSLVKTLTHNFKEIQSIKFLVGGQETETLAGHIDISRPLRLDDLSR
jgi:hypothetical protein